MGKNRGKSYAEVRAELKAGKTRSGYITACKCGERGLRSERTLIAIRKSGIRSQNIERGGFIPERGREKRRGREGKNGKGAYVLAESEKDSAEEMATFSFTRGTRRMSPSPAITGVHVPTVGRRIEGKGRRIPSPDRGGVAGKHGPLDFMRDSI